jgi:hypothetical protein
MARPAFNWAKLDRTNLTELFGELRGQLVNRKVTINQAGQLIRRHIKKHLPVSVTCSRYAPVKSNQMWIGGVYYSNFDLKKRKRFIEVQLAFSQKEKHIEFTDYYFAKTARRFADLILHELIHCRQYRSRKFKEIYGYQSQALCARERKEQEYYADPDEMGAYAFNIACLLRDRFGNNSKKINHYLNNTPRRYKRVSSWQDFLKAFNWDHDHFLVKRMKRKINRQLEMADLGRPFRTTNFLTY